MRNEYEAKIYELNEDLNFLKKQLKEQDQNNSNKKNLNDYDSENLEIISDLNEKLVKISNELKASETKLVMSKETEEDLKEQLSEKERIIMDNTKLQTTYQSEVTISYFFLLCSTKKIKILLT